ncbi:MAG: AAA family ATPase [Candidatus Omnitrophota bacterium]
MKKLKKIFIAATHQNDGKTALSLGLIRGLKAKGKIGFIKPVGQRYLIEEDEKIDEDSLLIEKTFGLECDLKDTSPIAIERGFTENYILRGKRRNLSKKIISAFERVSKGKDLVVIEGTGHAGVGSVFDFSNAKVARILKSKVIMISSGGIGRPIDEIMLNKALFDKAGVQLIGVIVNKVLPQKFDKVSKLVKLGLKKKGLETFGVIPYHPSLSRPTISQIFDETEMTLLLGEKNIGNIVDKVIVGAMEVREAIKHIERRSLVITPGDREDIILAAINKKSFTNERRKIAGFILSGGIVPKKKVLKEMEKSGVPVLISKDDTYTTSSLVHDLIVKVRPEDKIKIRLIEQLVKKYVDLDHIYDRL